MTDRERAAAPDQPAEVREVVAIERPLTASDLADAFGCMWNAAIGAARQQDGGFEFASILAEGFSAMHARLSEIAADARDAPARPTVGETWETPKGPVMVVPVEPTKFVLTEEFCGSVRDLAKSNWNIDACTRLYRAMLAATAKEKPHAG